MKFTSLLLLFLPLFAFSQTPPPDNLVGIQLRDWLKANWYDGKISPLTYSQARRKMYAYIDNDNGIITGVYGGYQKSNPYGNETTSVYPINCEHTVPQSLFDSREPMKSDIHHLFPTNGKFNSERSNNEFEDIPDQETKTWMQNSTCQSEIPISSLIDEYSESNMDSTDWFNPLNRFEPREVQKGNTARAVFYFYNMYPGEAGNIGNIASLATLCTWHRNDPPDAREMLRNDEIELYQGNRNPYIDYPDADRAWGCNVILTGIQSQVEAESLKVFPNPFNDYLNVAIEKKKTTSPIIVSLYDVTGREIYKTEKSSSEFRLSLGELPAGLYLLVARQNGQVWQQRIVH